MAASYVGVVLQKPRLRKSTEAGLSPYVVLCVQAAVTIAPGQSHDTVRYFRVTEEELSLVENCFWWHDLGLPVSTINELISVIGKGMIVGIQYCQDTNQVLALRSLGFQTPDAFTRLITYYHHVSVAIPHQPLLLLHPNSTMLSSRQEQQQDGDRITLRISHCPSSFQDSETSSQTTRPGSLYGIILKNGQDDLVEAPQIQYPLKEVTEAFNQLNDHVPSDAPARIKLVQLDSSLLFHPHFQSTRHALNGYLQPTDMMVMLSRLMMASTTAERNGKPKPPSTCLHQFIKELRQPCRHEIMACEFENACREELSGTVQCDNSTPLIDPPEPWRGCGDFLDVVQHARREGYQVNKKGPQVACMLNLMRQYCYDYPREGGIYSDQTSLLLIDIGCGRGDFAVACAEALHCTVMGIDVNPTSLQAAEQLASDRHLSSSSMFITGDIGGPDAPRTIRRIVEIAQQYDKVVFSGLHACGELSDVIHLFARLLNQSGISSYIVCVPCCYTKNRGLLERFAHQWNACQSEPSLLVKTHSCDQKMSDRRYQLLALSENDASVESGEAREALILSKIHNIESEATVVSNNGQTEVVLETTTYPGRYRIHRMPSRYTQRNLIVVYTPS